MKQNAMSFQHTIVLLSQDGSSYFRNKEIKLIAIVNETSIEMGVNKVTYKLWYQILSS